MRACVRMILYHTAIPVVIRNNGFIKTQDIHREDCVRE